MQSLPLLLAISVPAAILAGCKKEEIRVYHAPKEKTPVRAMAQHPSTPRLRPQVIWTLPKGWKEMGPGQMSVASFAITGPGGQEAQVTITPLTQLAGREAVVVNMWRQQMGLEEISPEAVTKQLQPVEVGSEKGKLFEVSGKAESGSEPVRIVTAMVHRSDASWFYKLSGDATLVETQKPIFIEFLKSIRLTEAAPTDADSTAAGSKPKWQVPTEWKELPPGQMQVAKFALPERSGAKAEVFVSVFDTDTGGTLANVNRWRRQIGLAEIQQNELKPLLSSLDPANPQAMLVDMTNNNKRLLGAIVPRGGRYWFYKLQGDADAVTPEKEDFMTFAKSQP
jgi:hypothetical protein